MQVYHFFLILFTIHGHAHTTIIPNGSLAPRSQNPGLKRAPCGGVQRSPMPARHKAGSQIELAWKETKDHPGYFAISFSSANDSNFVLLKNIPDTQDNIETLPHFYSEKITMPNIVCEACTIQLVQVMMENPQRPTFYYSCADITLTP